LERSTRDRNRQHVELHIAPLIGARKLSQITTPAVHAFADELARNGRSAAMVKGVLVSLGAIFGEARRRGLVVTNPVADARVKLGERRKSPRPTIPTREELRAVLHNAAGKHRALIVTAIFTGLRASELRGLRWRNVDLKAGVVTVAERVDQWGNAGPPKSEAGYRDVPLAPYALSALKEHRLAAAGGDDALLFASRTGTPLTHQNMVKRIWNPLQVKAGLVTDAGKARYGFHVLRHAAASLFIEQRLSPKRISALMGHSSIQITYNRYGHLLHDGDADQAALAAIEARLLG
jgi:integrase